MRNSVVAHRRPAIILLLSSGLLLTSGCVKLPRSISTTTAARTERQIPRQEKPAKPLVNINTATPVELEQLPGIGKALAARIVAHRQRYGRFRRTEHLIIVNGISDRRFRALSDFITVE